MTTLQIKLPDDLRAIADQQVSSGQYPDYSTYISSLIRQDLQRRETESMLLARLGSNPGTEMTDADFDRLHARLDARAADRSIP